MLALSNAFVHFFYRSGGKTPDVKSRTYTQIMREQMLQGEEKEVFTMKMLTYSFVHNVQKLKKKLLFFFIVAQDNSRKIERWNTCEIIKW